MSMQDDNPFKAPSAHVSDYSAGGPGGTLDLDGQRLSAGAGVDWIKGGWALFKLAPGAWIGLLIVWFVVLVVLSVVPLVNMVSNLLMPVFVGGIMLGCKALDDGEPFTVGHLFAGFSRNAGSLVLIGLLYLLGIVVVMFFAGGSVIAMMAANGGFTPQSLAHVGPGFFLVILLAVAVMMPLAMAVWFAPALVVLHDVPPWAAMKASFFASLRNWLPFLIYGLCYFVLAILAIIPIGLGFLILGPVMMASMYVAYKAMFLRTA